MSDIETDALKALDRLLLQQGISGGELARYYFPAVVLLFSCLSTVNRVLERFEERTKERFPNERVQVKK